MKYLHRLRHDQRGGTTQIEIFMLGCIAVTVGIALVSVSARARGSLVETDAPVFAFAETSSLSATEEGLAPWARVVGALGSVPVLGSLHRVKNNVARRGLALVTIAPIDWESWGIERSELDAYARYRAPIVEAVSETATTLVPALVAVAVETIQDPSSVIEALKDPVGIAQAMVTGTYEDVRDWATVVWAEDDDESSRAASRVASSLVAGRILAIGGRALPRKGLLRGHSWKHLNSEHFLREVMLKQQKRAADVVVTARRGKVGAAIQTRVGRSSLGFELVGRFSERDALSLLRTAIHQSEELGFEGRLRTTGAKGLRPFLTRQGFVQLFNDAAGTASDLVLPKQAAQEIIAGRIPRSRSLGEWVDLPEYEAARIRQYAPELYHDVKRIAIPDDPDNYDFIVQRVPNYRGPAIILGDDRPRVLLDAKATPDARALTLANEVGERSFVRPQQPTWNYRDAFAFIRTHVADEVEAKGAAVIYEMQTRKAMTDRLGYQVASRYSEEMTEVLDQLLVNDGVNRRFAGKYWVSHNPQYDLQERARYYQDIWQDRLPLEQQAAVDAADQILRGAFDQ